MEAEYIAYSTTPPFHRLSAGWGANQSLGGGCYKWSVRRVSYHYIEDIVESGEIEVYYIPLVEINIHLGSIAGRIRGCLDEQFCATKVEDTDERRTLQFTCCEV